MTHLWCRGANAIYNGTTKWCSSVKKLHLRCWLKPINVINQNYLPAIGSIGSRPAAESPAPDSDGSSISCIIAARLDRLTAELPLPPPAAALVLFPLLLEPRFAVLAGCVSRRIWRMLVSWPSSWCLVKGNMHYFGDRRFTAAGPCVWNRLPVHLRQDTNYARFKRQLKTFLFVN